MNRRMRTIVLSLFALPLMANDGCDENKVRALKHRIDLEGIKARSFTLPGGKPIDFSWVINGQFPSVVSSHPRYVIRDGLSGTVTKLSQKDHPQGDGGLMFTLSKMGYRSFAAAGQPTVPACVRDLPMAILDGTVLGFEFVDGFSVRVGYNQNGEIPSVPGGSVKVSVKRAQLDINLRALQPGTNVILASGMADSKQTETTVNATIDFSGFEIGPEYWFTTPLAKVTQSGLKKVLDDLDRNLASVEWRTYVRDVGAIGSEVTVLINAGIETGVKVGDEFSVSNLNHKWEGAVCNSRYIGNVPVPVGTIQISQVGDNISQGILLPGGSDRDLQIGAKVTISKLAQ